MLTKEWNFSCQCENNIFRHDIFKEIETKHNAEHQRTAPSTKDKGSRRYFTGRIFLQTAKNIAIIQQTQTKTRDPVPVFTLF